MTTFAIFPPLFFPVDIAATGHMSRRETIITGHMFLFLSSGLEQMEVHFSPVDRSPLRRHARGAPALALRGTAGLRTDGGGFGVRALRCGLSGPKSLNVMFAMAD